MPPLQVSASSDSGISSQSVPGSSFVSPVQIKVLKSLGPAFLENNLAIALKLFAPQPLDSISVLGIYSIEAVIQMHENTCMRMFVFTLLIIVGKNRNDLNVHQ